MLRRAGEMRSVNLFLNFPIMDMDRNALWRNPEGVDEADLRRMTRFWGDESWRQARRSGNGSEGSGPGGQNARE